MTDPQKTRRSRPRRLQVSGARKDELIRRAVAESAELDEEVVAQIADHLSALIEVIQSKPETIERYRTPRFDPHSFSALKIYRSSKEAGLRRKLEEIGDSRHLQDLAKAQQIGLVRRLRGEAADPHELREAIVQGVRKRFEDWEAAS